MKRFTILILAVLMALALAACEGQQNGTGEATPGGETSETISDAIAATEPATEPGVIVVDPAATVEAGGSGIVTTAGTSSAAALDTTGLPVTAAVHVIPATPYDNSQPPSPIGLPEHIRVDFTVEGQTAPSDADPVMYIIPTADYAALWEGAGDMGVSGTLAGLQALVRERYEPFPAAGIPVLPVERIGSAFNDLSVQGKYLDLEGLSGLRFVGRFVHEPTAITNEGLTYVFQGFTDDGKYYVSFLYPISTSALPADLASADATELELFYADIDAYMAERDAALNQLAETDWSPSLAALDAVLASLQIPGPEAVDVVAVESSPLTGTTWYWQRTGGPAMEMNVVDPARYSVTFNEDGTVAIQADCNSVGATYTTSADNALTIALGPSTLAACGPESQDQQFLEELAAARFYFVEPSSLAIEVAEDGTIMLFMPAGELAQGITTESTGNVFLVDGVWEWTATSDPLGITTVADPAQYTIDFGQDGTAAIRADCNNVGATYTATDDGGMTIQLGPSTLAACGPESRDAEFLQSLEAIVFYFGEGDSLAMEMMADGGVMSFNRGQQQEVVVEPEGEVTVGALAGPIWQWTVLRQLNGETAVPEPTLYTITFHSDGTAAIRADCSVAGATYEAGTDGSLMIAPGPTTQPDCGPNSLDQVFLGGLGAAQSYVIEDGALAISLQLDNGTMVLVPVN